MNQQQFYEKIPEWISHPKDRWNHITLMAYFCYKYEQKHGVKFRLVRWKSDPGRGKESRDFAKLFKILAPENYDELNSEEKSFSKTEIIKKIYNYINWMFDYKFRRGERSVTGTGLFLMPSMINEFERMYSKFLRDSAKKGDLKELMLWASDNLSEIFDDHEIEGINDIRMIESYIKAYSLTANSMEAVFVKKAKEMGVI